MGFRIVHARRYPPFEAASRRSLIDNAFRGRVQQKAIDVPKNAINAMRGIFQAFERATVLLTDGVFDQVILDGKGD